MGQSTEHCEEHCVSWKTCHHISLPRFLLTNLSSARSWHGGCPYFCYVAPHNPPPFGPDIFWCRWPRKGVVRADEALPVRMGNEKWGSSPRKRPPFSGPIIYLDHKTTWVGGWVQITDQITKKTQWPAAKILARQNLYWRTTHMSPTDFGEHLFMKIFLRKIFPNFWEALWKLCDLVSQTHHIEGFFCWFGPKCAQKSHKLLSINAIIPFTQGVDQTGARWDHPHDNLKNSRCWNRPKLQEMWKFVVETALSFFDALVQYDTLVDTNTLV